MSESKHTPGPWLFHAPWAGFSKITGPSDELIFGIAAGGSEEAQPDDVCDANARLIAAAPDLLEALTAIRAEQRDGYCSDATRDRADAVIARATSNPPPPSVRPDERGSVQTLEEKS